MAAPPCRGLGRYRQTGLAPTRAPGTPREPGTCTDAVLPAPPVNEAQRKRADAPARFRRRAEAGRPPASSTAGTANPEGLDEQETASASTPHAAWAVGSVRPGRPRDPAGRHAPPRAPAHRQLGFHGPGDPATTPGMARQQPKKNPWFPRGFGDFPGNPGISIWWRWAELNRRPKALHPRHYMLSSPLYLAPEQHGAQSASRNQPALSS